MLQMLHSVKVSKDDLRLLGEGERLSCLCCLLGDGDGDLNIQELVMRQVRHVSDIVTFQITRRLVFFLTCAFWEKVSAFAASWVTVMGT